MVRVNTAEFGQALIKFAHFKVPYKKGRKLTRHEWKVFLDEDSLTKDEFQMATKCEITFPNACSVDVPVGVFAVARCHPDDKFEKELGRQESLLRAIQMISHKSTRQELMEGYLNRPGGREKMGNLDLRFSSFETQRALVGGSGLVNVVPTPPSSFLQFSYTRPFMPPTGNKSDSADFNGDD